MLLRGSRVNLARSGRDGCRADARPGSRIDRYSGRIDSHDRRAGCLGGRRIGRGRDLTLGARRGPRRASSTPTSRWTGGGAGTGRGSGAGLGIERLDNRIAIRRECDEHLDLLFGTMEGRVAGPQQTDPFLEGGQRLFEPRLAVFELIDNAGQLAQRVLEGGRRGGSGGSRLVVHPCILNPSEVAVASLSGFTFGPTPSYVTGNSSRMGAPEARIGIGRPV